jgi:hypothetical protein
MSWTHVNYIKYPQKDYKPGHQKVSKQTVEEIVERLNVNKVYSDCNGPEMGKDTPEKKFTEVQVNELLERIADKDVNMLKTPDRQRTGADNYFNAWRANDIVHNMWKR